MTPEKKRQATLIGALVVAVVGYLRFGGGAGFSLSQPEGPADLPRIDAKGLEDRLKDISTVKPEMFPVDGNEPSVPDRNLFQYGPPRAAAQPTPPPMTEAQRLAAQQALQQQEEALRAQKQQQQQQAQAGAAGPPAGSDATPADPTAIAQAQPPAPTPPPAPPQPVRPDPPPINFKLIGVLGSPQKKIAVFLDGNDQLLARKGDVLQAKYKVLEIGVEWAEVGYVDPTFSDLKKRIGLGS